MGGLRASKRKEEPQLNTVTTPEMYAAIRAQSIATGLSMRQVIHDALCLYFDKVGKPLGSSVTLEAAEQVNHQFKELVALVDALRTEVNQLRAAVSHPQPQPHRKS